MRSGRIYDYYKDTLLLKLGIVDGSDSAFADLSKAKISKLQKSKLTGIHCELLSIDQFNPNDRCDAVGIVDGTL